MVTPYLRCATAQEICLARPSSLSVCDGCFYKFAGNRKLRGSRQQEGDPCLQTEEQLLAVVAACGAASDRRRVANWADRACQTERLRARLARLSAGGDALSPATAAHLYPFCGPQTRGPLREAPRLPDSYGFAEGLRAGSALSDVAQGHAGSLPRGVHECVKAAPAAGCGAAWSYGGSRLGSLDFPDTPVPAGSTPGAAGGRGRSWSATSSLSVQSDLLAALAEGGAAAYSVLALYQLAQEQQHQAQQQQQQQQHQCQQQGWRYHPQQQHQQQPQQQPRHRLATISATDGCAPPLHAEARHRGPVRETASASDPPHAAAHWCSLSWSSGVPMDIGAGEAV